jgi:rsbT co-antagonist protein RsbR
MHQSLSRAPSVVIELDDALSVVGWNERAERLFATPSDAATGRPLAELLPTAASWQELLADERDDPQRLVVTHPTAGERHLDVWARRGGDPPATLTVHAHDVTARVASDRRQRLESALYTALTSHLELAVWAIDRRGTFLLQEGKALRTIGMTDGQLCGTNIFEVYGGTSDISLIEDAVAGTPGHTPPGPAPETHGVQWESWFVPVEGPASEAAVLGISLNVTESRRREEELRAKLDLIERQRETIRELSTPIIEIWDGVLTLPIVGLVDSVRTAEIMDNLLQTVSRTRSRFAILDLTGVQVVDTSTASHLIGLIQAIRLLGAEGVLTGIHPNIAQTIVAIGVDLSRVHVFARLRDALEHCIAQLRPRK